MAEENGNRTEIRRLRRLLKEIADLAQHASLTDSLKQGARSAVQRYNQVLTRLEALDVVSPGLFQPLPADASFDEVGVDSKLLAGYLEEDEEEAGGSKGQQGGPNIIVGSLNGLQGLEELKDLGRQIRESLPDWIRERTGRGEAPSNPPQPAPEAASPSPQPQPQPEPMPDFNRQF